MVNLENKNKSFQKAISIAKSFKKIKNSINIFFIGVPTILILLFHFTTMNLSPNSTYLIELGSIIFSSIIIAFFSTLIIHILDSSKLYKFYNRKILKK